MPDIPICPICKLPPRQGDDMNKNLLRIWPGWVEGLPHSLYCMCKDCWNMLAPRKAAHEGKTLEDMSAGDFF